MIERRIKSGGLEQALLQLAEEEGVISEQDKKRLEELKSMPKDRHEFVDADGQLFIGDYSPSI